MTANQITKPPRLSANTFRLALTSFFADIATEMLYPVLPIFLTQVLGATGAVVGLVEGMAEATHQIVQGLSGWLSDRLQTRKPIALVGYGIAALAKPLIGLAGAWPAVLGWRFLDRFGTGTRSAPRDALIAASADEANRGRAFGLEGFGDNLGAFVGPLIAVLLLTTFHVPIRSIFYLAAFPGLAALFMIGSVRERRVAVAAKASLAPPRVALPTAYWRYLGAMALFGIGNSSNAFLILQAKATGLSTVATILIYAAYNLIAALASYPAGALSDRFGRRGVLIAALGVFAAVYFGFAFTHAPIVLAAGFALYGLYQGIFRSVGRALAADLVPAAARASGVGWYAATVGASGLVASLVAGQLWDRFGHPAVFVLGTVTAVIGMAALALLRLEPARVA